MISVSVSIFSLDWVLSFSMLFSINIDLSSSRRILLMIVMTSSSLASMAALSISNSSGSFPPLFAMLYGGVSQKWGLNSRLHLQLARVAPEMAGLFCMHIKENHDSSIFTGITSLASKTDSNSISITLLQKNSTFCRDLNNFRANLKVILGSNIQSCQPSYISLITNHSRKPPTSRSSNTMTPPGQILGPVSIGKNIFYLCKVS
jgi:hypothetical protein